MTSGFLVKNKSKALIALLKQDRYRMDILEAVAEIKDRELWISGGFVRNMVWDFQHKHKHRTELGDVDVFYYDRDIIDKGEEIIIVEKLHAIWPNVNWSVKNQARMHYHDNNIQYTSLYDALSKFPDTSSAVAVRLDDKNEICIIAPFGLNDLFGLVVRPTPNCKKNYVTREKYTSRYINKGWKKNWKLLKIIK